ncbi:MAG: T9SS type A sorting domain-containing protein [Bacteroidota bacterium]
MRKVSLIAWREINADFKGAVPTHHGDIYVMSENHIFMYIRIYLALFLLGGASYTLSAQDYRLFFKERNTFFEEGNKAFSLDSIEIAGIDEIWHNYEAKPVCRGDWTDEDSSMIWLTEPFTYDSIIGNYHFLNRDSDTIVFQSQASLDERWVLFRFPDSSYIEARVQAVEAESFLDIKDSVKKAVLQLYSANGDSLASEWNSTLVQWSQSLGVVHFFNVYKFPKEKELFPVIGLSNPRIGFGGLTDSDFGDLKVGTIWQLWSNSSGRYYEVNTYSSFEILSLLGNDQYMVRRQMGRSNYQNPDGGQETIDTTYSDTTLIMDLAVPRLGEEELPFRESEDGFIRYRYQGSIGRWQKNIQYAIPPNQSYWQQTNSPCITWYPGNEDIYYNNLIEGLPILFSSRSGGMGQHVYSGSTRIRYLKDEIGEFGQMVDFQPFIDYVAVDPPTPIPTQPLVDLATLYPNPVQEELNFWVDEQKYEGPIIMTIYNIYGQQVLSRELEVDIPINLTRLAPGIYQVYMFHSNDLIFQGKLKKL